MSKHRTRLTTALLMAGLVALLVIVAATFWLSQRAQLHALDVASLRDVRVSAAELHNSLLTAESSQRGYLYTQNEIYLAPYDGARNLTVRALRELEQASQAHGQFQEAISRLSQLVSEKLEEMDQSIGVMKDRSARKRH